ncbi:MAG TPA: Ig-like domain repeat protein [Solirubrobacteraceae bacterium]|nr:Ig-like domain repeat protein [Solirubrobacteraceae bacterium]
MRRMHRRTRIFVCLVVSAVTAGWMVPGAAQAAGPPANTVAPTIAGTPEQGQQLTVTRGTWTDATVVTITDTWQVCTGATCADIPGATALTYTVTASDVGHVIKVAETASATDGMTTVTSAPTATVTGNSAPPTISGSAVQGQTLTLHQGTWTNAPSVSDQWERCAPGGASCTATGFAATYVLVAADVGHTIEVVETATDARGTLIATSAPTATVVAGSGPTPVAAPSITGTPQQGSVLTVRSGTWTPAPTSVTHQWYRCSSAGASCAAISGATAQTYTLAAADVGSTLLVVETAADASGTASAPSPLTGVITTPAGNVPVPVNESPPTVSGQPEQGQTLVAANGAWSGNPASYSYQWERCSSPGCAAIPGATGQSYTAGAADVGQTLAVLETATNRGGAGRPAASARTRPVIATSVITFVASPGGPLTNQTVTMVATVGSGSGNVNPSGSLTFFNGDTPIGNCGRQAFQSASQNVTLLCQTAFPAGTVRLSAVFTPADGLLVAGSASQLTLDVGKDRTSTSLAVTKQVSRDRRAIYRATVVLPVSNSGPLDPTGSMEFFDRGRPIRGCLKRPVTRLAATCKVRYNAFGRHTISARYSGDANFGGSHSAARSVRIVNPASAPVVLGFIGSTLQWQFAYHPRYTLVTTLRANQVAKGSTLVLACSGSGCPFTQLAIPSGAASSINLLPEFHGHHLGIGSQITLRIIRQHWIGKYYSFTMRPGRGPQIVLSCLGVGRTRPGVGC